VNKNLRWKSLGWRHPVWELVRYFRAIRGAGNRAKWLDTLAREYVIRGESDDVALRIEKDQVDVLVAYLKTSPEDLAGAFARFRSEDEANAFCKTIEAKVLKTTTKNVEHHQSSKAMIAAVATIAELTCSKLKIKIDPNPQRRCIWCSNHGLHVSARNLDGAIPGLLNPAIVWEIKEYWGQTGGGSKMSDAVYECNLVGRELREFEERTSVRVTHMVFIDGKTQWESRRSDVVRFIDLFHQGLIDDLIIGKDVETEWEPLLRNLLK
jgi:hypothetical protein